MTTAQARAPSITVIGPGAVGGLLAVSLCQTGAQVSVLAREHAARTLATHGLTLLDGAEVQHARPRIVQHGAEIGVQDVVVLAIKSDQVDSVVPHLDALVGPETCVVTTMNGLPWWFIDSLPRRVGQLPHAISGRIPSRQIVGCLVFVNCSRTETGVVRRNAGRRMVVGAAAEGAPHAERFAALLAQTNFDVQFSDDIRLDLWDKLIGNAVLNPLTALVRLPIGGVHDDPQACALASAAMAEIALLGAELGLECTASPAERLAALSSLRSCRTSMLQDVLAGRPTEIDAMLDPLLALGEAVGIAMPVMSTIFTLARLLQPEQVPSAPHRAGSDGADAVAVHRHPHLA
ncbi:ketopantoate reductase family protein [Paraburkholderia fungorum]|uniref:ketopantoate reductase family protein n=1 Tax=Paraburkholderia fungorum TaxID=134537 RepID=UPI00402B11BF